MTPQCIRPLLPSPALALVTDSARLHGRELADVVRLAVDGGANVVQLREKSLDHAARVRLGASLHDAIRGRALLFVNGDVDAALALDADGVHLPEDAPPVAVVRARVGERMLIARAVHSLDAAVRAERDGADVLQLGTVFATASKPGSNPLGTDGVRGVSAAVRLPVIAIGGITPSSAPNVIRAGSAGVAVIGAIFDADDPRAAAASLRRALAVAARV